MNGDYIDHVVARDGGGSVEANQVLQDKLWSVVWGHASTVADEMLSNV